MKIILSGGYDKYSEQSFQKSIFLRYKNLVKDYISSNKKVAVITLAKKDAHYDQKIKNNFSTKTQIINFQNYKNVNYSDFDLIIFPGGDTLKLSQALQKVNFKLRNLKPDIVLIGDSAGAFILSAYFFDQDENKKLSFYQGFNPDSKLITIAHMDNSRYVDQDLVGKVETFAKQKNLKVVKLKENKEKTLIF